MLYLLEARAMRMRRARLAFTIRSDDEDVKSCLDNPVQAPPQAARPSTRYKPYPRHEPSRIKIKPLNENVSSLLSWQNRSIWVAVL